MYQYAVFTSIPGVSIHIINQYTGCANIRNIQGVTVYSIHLQYTGCTNVQNPKVITGCINIPYPPVYIYSIHQHAGWINTYNPPVCRCQGISINYVHQYKGEPIQYFQYTGYINKLRPPVYTVYQYSIFSTQGISINYVHQYTGWTNTVFSVYRVYQ